MTWKDIERSIVEWKAVEVLDVDWGNKITIIQIYAPKEVTEEFNRDELNEKVQEVLDGARKSVVIGGRENRKGQKSINWKHGKT